MKQNLTKSFTLIFGGILILLLNLIPDHDIGGMLSAAGMGFNFDPLSVIVVLIGIVLIVLGARNILNTQEINHLDGAKVFVYLIIGGALLALVSLFLNGSIQLIVKVAEAALLLIGYFQLKKKFHFNYDLEATKGALWVLIGGVMAIYQEVGSGIGFQILAVVGFILFFLGLGKLVAGLDDMGAKGAKKIRLAVILAIIATVIDMIPLMGLIAGIIAIVAFIIELTGYLALKKSGSLQDIGQRGAKLLVINMILLLVAGVFGLLPLVGDMIVGFIAAISLILWSVGWMRIELGTVKEN